MRYNQAEEQDGQLFIYQLLYLAGSVYGRPKRIANQKQNGETYPIRRVQAKVENLL